MESNDELKKKNIKNRTCFCFDNIIRVRGISPNNILLNEKSHRKTLIYEVSYKTFMSEKPLCIWFDKIDGFIKIYHEIRYLVLFNHGWYDEIFIGLDIL